MNVPLSDFEHSPSRVVSFRNSRWKTRSVVIGLAVLLLWRAFGFLDPQWFSQFPVWLLLTVLGLAPTLFLLIFPFLTRDPNRPRTFGIPGARRWLTELVVAVPVVVGTVLVLAVTNYLLGRLSPGTSLTPDAIRNMAASPDRGLVYLVLLFTFTLVPVAEEVFFRGFLHNAFRRRMPILVAAVVQSLIFGVAHLYGALQIGVVFVMGLVLTAVYEWRKTLLTPILVHAGINLIAALATVAMMFAYANRPVLGVVGDLDDVECVVRDVAPGSAAEEAGLQTGDVITSFNGEPIRDFPHLAETIALYRPGDAIPVTVRRSGSEFEITVVLRRRGDP